MSDAAEPFCDQFPILCNAPDDPNTLIAGVLGYATGAVNMRGTGRFGGFYDHHEPLQLLAKALANPDYIDEIAKPVDPSSFVQNIDGLAPQSLMEWFIVLELCVAQRVSHFDETAAGDRTTLPEGDIESIRPPYVYPALADAHAVA